MTGQDYDSAVAVVGMAGRFPGAGSVTELWRNLMSGRRGLRSLTEAELRQADVDPLARADDGYVPVTGAVDGMADFDAAAFGFSPREAETMDPQHRLLLESCWQALEDAGYPPVAPPGPVGIFAGSGYPDYLDNHLRHLGDEPGGRLLLAVGNERDSLASLVSHRLDLRGPSLTVQTFCSTSLVAVHLACQSLLTFECDLALAGGVYVSLPQPSGYRYEEGGILSPDGQVLSFDAAARGTVMGNGVAMVTLKRMVDALADGDTVHAVVLGSAVNNDGAACAGYTAPGIDGQAAVIRSALDVAGVDPDTIGYLECHATGTMLGDSIELAAMSRVFDRRSGAPCVLGSLKPSLGHLDRASGTAGLIRAALALRTGTLPEVPGFRTPNPTLAMARDRFTVLTHPQPWPPTGTPRRAGVNSFGFGGTNAHVVLEEPPAPPAPVPSHGPYLLVFSARHPAALDELCGRLREHLVENPDLDLGDVAVTLQQSRSGFPIRRSVICADRADALSALADASRWTTTGPAARESSAATVELPAPPSVDASYWIRLGRAVESVFAGATEAVRPTGTGRASVDAASAAALLTRALRAAGADVIAPDGPPPAADGSDRVRVVVSGDPAIDRELLDGVARLWHAGAELRWSALATRGRRRVPLPTYPFQRTRHWLDARPLPRPDPGGTGRIPDPARWAYMPGWRREPAPAGAPAGPWLVLAADPYGTALVERLRTLGATATRVRPGPAFARTGADEFVVRPDSAADLAAVLSALPQPPRRVIHGFSLAGPEEPPPAATATRFAAAQTVGYFSAVALVAAVTRAVPGDCGIVLLTDGAATGGAADLDHPEHASLGALAPSVTQENPAVTCRHVDVDAAREAQRRRLDRLAAMVVAEATVDPAGPAMLRGGERWVRGYDRIDTTAPGAGNGPHPAVAGGTVLITGGLGDVGLVLARHLALTHRCALVLTGRTAVPPRDEWARWSAPERTGTPVGRRVRALLDLERAGARVLTVAADVGQVDQMRQVLGQARERFGSLDAVVHGAGLSDRRYFGVAHEVSRDAAEAHFHAKVNGFLALQEALGDDAPDARFTLSSLAAVLGGLGLGPYAAANAALDAYALSARGAGAGQWLTVNWDTWLLGGHAGPGRPALAMSPDEGTEMFTRVTALADTVGHVVVSTGDLDARVRQWVVSAGAASAPDEPEPAARRHARPALSTRFREPSGEVQTRLAGIWAEGLGLDRVGAADNFYDLNGNSLTAIRLMDRIRREFAVSVPATALLENPTVQELATVIVAAGGGPDAPVPATGTVRS
ncbi:SDR family NAD(P)-dependent oxidoreductase [Micromonospora echinospora]|uniref:SDR family NAD(P)-dependent oxidoreductase n=1 Tax=Micromonospora echinospora TaxID=1877 RepID=UPI00379AEECD